MYEGVQLSDPSDQKTSHNVHMCAASPLCEKLGVASNNSSKRTTCRTYHRRTVSPLCVCARVGPGCLSERTVYHNVSMRKVFRHYGLSCDVEVLMHMETVCYIERTGFSSVLMKGECCCLLE